MLVAPHSPFAHPGVMRLRQRHFLKKSFSLSWCLSSQNGSDLPASCCPVPVPMIRRLIWCGCYSEPVFVSPVIDWLPVQDVPTWPAAEPRPLLHLKTHTFLVFLLLCSCFYKVHALCIHLGHYVQLVLHYNIMFLNFGPLAWHPLHSVYSPYY